MNGGLSDELRDDSAKALKHAESRDQHAEIETETDFCASDP